jgi:hypothetical protein
MIAPLNPTQMNNARLESLFREMATDVEGEPGYWTFTVVGVSLICLTDDHHDRMRIISPVSAVGELAPGELENCMEANFDRALDARYCVSRETLWSAFIHPLGDLSEELLRSGVKQVVDLARNFGTSYSSGALVFGGNVE